MPTFADINAQRAKVGASQVKNPAVPTAQSFTQTPGQTYYGTSKPTDTPLPTKNTPNIVTQGYNINTDPTYSGMIGPDSGYNGPIQTSGNVGPTAGQNYTDINGNPQWKSIAQQVQEAGDAAAAQPGYTEDKLRARQAAEANALARINAEQNKRAADRVAGQQQMNQGAGAAKVNQVDQNAVEAARAQGMTDSEIRTHIQNGTLPNASKPLPFGNRTSAAGIQANITGSPIGAEGAIAEAPAATTPQPVAATTPTPTPTTSAPATPVTPTTPTAQTNAPPQSKTAPPPPVDTSLGALSAALTTALAGNPLGEVYKQAILQDYQAEQTAKANALASLSASTAQAEQANTDTQAFLEKWADKATANSRQLTDVLTKINDSTNSYLQTQKANDLATLNFNRDVDVQKQERAKTQDLLKSSISMALAGGSYSGAGQAAMAESERNWDTAIQNISQAYAFKAADISGGYTQKYVDAKNQLNLNLFNASTALDAKIEGYAGQGFNSLQSMKAAETNAKNAYRTEIDSITKEHATTLNGWIKEIQTQIDTKKKDVRDQEKLGWNILDDAVGRYGSLVPKSTIDRVTAMLPAGTDIRDYINTPTFAERNSKRISGSGGSGSGKIGSYDLSGITPQGLALSHVTANDLRGAVDRIFAPANYGGTAGERSEKRAQYLSRIASGESPASIASSLQSDYWASQKGAPRTAHDGRTEAQSSADFLQSFVDFYGVGGEEDGALGQIDSRVQGFLSVFKQSSQEYNDLSNTVGNIRARIIKENYGAAVTPQELEIAKSYVPDMTDHGAKFITKLQNLKSYNAYLDAKVFAANAGLPAPTPPVPVTLSGNKMTGAGKYSDADIDSAL